MMPVKPIGKVGLLTYHHVVNLGSVLQTYCGYKLIQALYPKSVVEIIDYYPRDSFLHNLSQRKFFTQWGQAEKLYQMFIRGNCGFSPFSIRSDEIAEGMEILRSAKYEAIFCGSDTVFQMNGYLGKYLAGPPAPNLYYLPGEISSSKFGLSVSFDPPQQVSKDQLSELGSYLDDFETIFYRDQHAQEVLGLMGLKADKLLFAPDPTLMVDLHTLIPANVVCLNDSRLIGVSVQNHKISKFVKSKIESMGLQPFDLLVPKPKSKRGIQFLQRRQGRDSEGADFVASGLSIYRKLRGLVTDRFHGSIFGLQLGDYPVVGIEDSSVYPIGHGKLWDLFNRLDLSKSVVRVSDSMVNDREFSAAWDSAASSIAHAKAELNTLRLQGIRNISGRLIKYDGL